MEHIDPPAVIAEVVALTVAELGWCLLNDRTADSYPSRYLGLEELNAIIIDAGGGGRKDAVTFWLEEHDYIRPATGTYWTSARVSDGPPTHDHVKQHTMSGPFITITPKVLDFRSGITLTDAVAMGMAKGYSDKQIVDYVEYLTGKRPSPSTIPSTKTKVRKKSKDS